MIGVEADLGGEVEGDREPRLTLAEQVAEAPVGLGRAPEAGVLPEGPEPPAIHRRLDASGVRVLAREADPPKIPFVRILRRLSQPGETAR